MIFIRELPQLLRLADVQPAILRLPRVNGVLRHAQLPRHICRCSPRFQLLQRPDHLRFAVLPLRHASPPRSAESYTLPCELRGADQYQENPLLWPPYDGNCGVLETPLVSRSALPVQCFSPSRQTSLVAWYQSSEYRDGRAAC